MSIYNSSLISAVDLAYHYGKKDPGLLAIAALQGEVVLDESGMAVKPKTSKTKSRIPINQFSTRMALMAKAAPWALSVPQAI